MNEIAIRNLITINNREEKIHLVIIFEAFCHAFRSTDIMTCFLKLVTLIYNRFNCLSCSSSVKGF